MDFICTANCMVQDAKRGVNLSATQGVKYSFPFDIRELSRHFKPLAELSASAAKRAENAEQVTVTSVDEDSGYEEQTRADLVEEAKDRRIPGADHMRKRQLIDALEEYDEVNAGALG